MIKDTWNIIDNTFAHDTYTVEGRDSLYINWDRTLKDKSNPNFYSHINMMNVNTTIENSYGLIYESRGIEPHTYSIVQRVIPYFKTVFTHSSELLQKFDNCKWIPGGGIWVGGRTGSLFGEGEIAIQKKSKLISMVSSNKTMCQGHYIRLAIFNELKDNKNIDRFYATSRSLDDGWVPIFRTLKDYMFSIAIENFVDDLYFTEKILNCFATGTIPVYLGAKNISSLFNPLGIIQLDLSSKESLHKTIETLTPELYQERLDAVYENFGRCQKFKCIEDYIYLTHFKK